VASNLTTPCTLRLDASRLNDVGVVQFQAHLGGEQLAGQDVRHDLLRRDKRILERGNFALVGELFGNRIVDGDVLSPLEGFRDGGDELHLDLLEAEVQRASSLNDIHVQRVLGRERIHRLFEFFDEFIFRLVLAEDEQRKLRRGLLAFQRRIVRID